MEQEKAILAAVEFQKESFPVEESVLELANLARTAGADVLSSFVQKRDKPDLRTFIGKGKLEDILAEIKTKGANILIFDNDLTPSQIRNLEEIVGIKVIDRTELILDIFAMHAHSHEGRLQVELAQSQFQMTRLSGKGIALSRLGGGIGTRGPGETKLEEDRRNIRKRISELRKEIEKLSTFRDTRRMQRNESGIKLASIIGYTNAGKSSLLNSLTKAGVLAENKLFATLDTTTKRLYLPGGNTILVSDTVGFIKKLPHQLVDSFKATLEEVTKSDLLIHVVDASNAVLEDQISAVYNVLEEIQAISKPILTVFNKMDSVTTEKRDQIKDLSDKYSPSVEISAVKKTGLEELKTAISSCLQQQK